MENYACKHINTSKILSGQNAMNNMIELCLQVIGKGRLALCYNRKSQTLCYNVGKILGQVGIEVTRICVGEKEQQCDIQEILQHHRLIVAVGDDEVSDVVNSFAYQSNIPYIVLMSGLPSLDILTSRWVQNCRFKCQNSPLAVVFDSRIIEDRAVQRASCIGELCGVLVDCIDLEFWGYASENKQNIEHARNLYSKVKTVIDSLSYSDNKTKLLADSILDIGTFLGEKKLPNTPTSIFGILAGHIADLCEMSKGLRKMIGACTISNMYAQMLKPDQIVSQNVDTVKLARQLAREVQVDVPAVVNKISLDDANFYKSVLQEYHNELYDFTIQVTTVIKRACKEFRRELASSGVVLNEWTNGALAVQIAQYVGILDGNNSILSLIIR